MGTPLEAEVKQAITRLLDALCTQERELSKESLLVLVPINPDDPIVVADSGKPLHAEMDEEEIIERLRMELQRRRMRGSLDNDPLIVGLGP